MLTNRLLAKLGMGALAGSGIAVLAAALFFFSTPAKASPNSWATGTWDASQSTCICPTFYAGCKCIIE
jgi:hypothetical protein